MAGVAGPLEAEPDADGEPAVVHAVGRGGGAAVVHAGEGLLQRLRERSRAIRRVVVLRRHQRGSSAQMVLDVMSIPSLSVDPIAAGP